MSSRDVSLPDPLNYVPNFRVKTYMRVRPKINEETEQTYHNSIKKYSNIKVNWNRKVQYYIKSNNKYILKRIEIHKGLQDDITQESFFNEINGKLIVDHALAGVNGSMIFIGGKDSGRKYTLFGNLFEHEMYDASTFIKSSNVIKSILLNWFRKKRKINKYRSNDPNKPKTVISLKKMLKLNDHVPLSIYSEILKYLYDKNMGILPRILNSLFYKLHNYQRIKKIDNFKMSFEFFEIIDEQIYDTWVVYVKNQNMERGKCKLVHSIYDDNDGAYLPMYAHKQNSNMKIQCHNLKEAMDMLKTYVNKRQNRIITDNKIPNYVIRMNLFVDINQPDDFIMLSKRYRKSKIDFIQLSDMNITKSLIKKVPQTNEANIRTHNDTLESMHECLKYLSHNYGNNKFDWKRSELTKLCKLTLQQTNVNIIGTISPSLLCRDITDITLQYIDNLDGKTMKEKALDDYKDRIELEDERNDLLKLKKVEIIKKGVMLKKGGIVKSWKRRHFILKSDKYLYYYEKTMENNETLYHLRGCADLTNITSIKITEDKTFEIVTPKRTWYFACQNNDERDQWVQTIKLHIIKL